ncbi:hypothetical protein PR1_16 [Providencia phage vB_PreS_PR1]|uniref:Uncharacterized protein n=1 Tax=Providencia phage vB_PreS_PR1 TaxID=1931407 RepID=A0A1S6KV93_9CAUD|nr:hypothetical protein FDH30_gp016 [Providencia phage vB_PreS_PR1]AQT25342.1 hypothetical protein PR1_16 [Providencia phage vB_PreS_PR1]
MIIRISGININNDLDMFDALASAGYAGALDRLDDITAELDVRDYAFRQRAGIEEAQVMHLLRELTEIDGLKISIGN